MKKKLSALLCALCMAMALCMSVFADTALPTLSAAAALTEGNKQVNVTVSLSDMGNVAKVNALKSVVAYNNKQVKFNSVQNGNVFDDFDPSSDFNDKGSEVIAFQASKNGTTTAGTAITFVFDVLDGVEGDIAFTVNGDITYYAEGAADPDTKAANSANASVKIASTPTVYNVNVTEPAEGGKVSVDKTTATAGETVTVTATPDTDYELDKIIVKAGDTQVDVKADGTFEMPASDVNVTATFKKVETPVYNITVAPYENGKVSVDKTTAKAGETVTVTATPDEGYVAKISVTTKSGATVAVKDAKFTMPAEDVTVTVTFTKKATDPSEKPSTSPSTNPSTSPSTKPSTTNKPSNKTTTVTATATPAPTAQPKPAAAIPQTGDTANLALYAVLFVASAMALGYVVYRKKANH